MQHRLNSTNHSSELGIFSSRHLNSIQHCTATSIRHATKLLLHCSSSYTMVENTPKPVTRKPTWATGVLLPALAGVPF